MSDTVVPVREVRTRRLLVALLGLATSAVSLWLAMRKVDFRETLAAIGQASIGILLLTQVTKLAAFLFLTLRSRVMLRPLHNYSFACLFKSVMVAFVGNAVLPVRLGELLRVGYLARRGGVPASSTLAVVAFERTLDTFSVLLILFAALVLGMTQLPVVSSGYVVAGILVFAIGLAFIASRNPGRCVYVCRRFTGMFGVRASDFVTEKVGRFADGLQALSSANAVITLVILTFCYWAALATTIQVWFWAFGLQLPWYAPIGVLLFVTLGAAIPSAPGYIGTYHYFGMLGLTAYGVQQTQAASVILVGHALAIVPFTVLGVALLTADCFRREVTKAVCGDSSSVFYQANMGTADHVPDVPS